MTAIVTHSILALGKQMAIEKRVVIQSLPDRYSRVQIWRPKFQKSGCGGNLSWHSNGHRVPKVPPTGMGWCYYG